MEIRLKELRTKIEDGWLKVFETENNAAEGRSKIPENRETSLNAGLLCLNHVVIVASLTDFVFPDPAAPSSIPSIPPKIS